jgi:hypothetical protein
MSAGKCHTSISFARLAGARAGSRCFRLCEHHAAAPTTTKVKSGPGYLHAVCINTPAAGGTITMYDNTAASGTKIGTLTSFANLPGCTAYDAPFWTGLTIVTASAAVDITVSFR